MLCALSGPAQAWWTITRTSLAFTPVRRLRSLTMATLSLAAAHEGAGRQMRTRKEARTFASHVAVGSGKKVAEASSADGDERDSDRIVSGGESSAADLEDRLWNLDKSNQLVTLTVVELRGLMKQMSRPTAGRKDDLIGEVRKWLASRDASASRWTTTAFDAAGPARDASSDGEAESLEETLLKAEGRGQQSDAVSKRAETFAGAALRNPSSEKPSVKKSPARGSPPNGTVESGLGAAEAADEAENSPTTPRQEGVVEEVEQTRVKSRGRRNGPKRGKKEAEEAVEDEEVSGKTKTTSKKRMTQVSRTGRSKKGKVTEDEREEQEAVVSDSGAGSKEPWTLLVHKKCQADWVAYNPQTMRPAPPPADVKTVKLLSWNVNGLRALIKDKSGVEEALHLTKLALEEDFDILCLQETKLQEKDVEKVGNLFLSNYGERCWSCSTSKLGYSGTAVLSRSKPVSIKYGMDILDHDSEGRLITVEFATFFLLTSYVPNSGEKLARLTYRTQEWDPALSKYIKHLESSKPVVLTGDLNCAHEEIDIHNPDGNKKSAGFTMEERVSFKENFLDQGLVDTFRRQHAKAVAYTYWGYRSGARPKNQGWRLDYFLVSDALMERVHDSYTLPDVMGSDHCPIGLILKV